MSTGNAISLGRTEIEWNESETPHPPGRRLFLAVARDDKSTDEEEGASPLTQTVDDSPIPPHGLASEALAACIARRGVDG